MMNKTVEGEYAISLKDLMHVVWRRIWIIILLPILFAGVAGGYSVVQVPVYEATVKMLVGQSGGLSQTANDAIALQQVTQTMSTAAYSRPVAEDVISGLDLETTPENLLDEMEVEPVPDTQFIEISYHDTNPETAQQVVNAFGAAFSTRIAQINDGGANIDASDITVTVWEDALAPEDPVSPNPLRNGALALVLGGFFGLGLVFLLEYFDDSWQSPEEAERISGVPTFGVVPRFDPSGSGKKKRSKGARKPDLAKYVAEATESSADAEDEIPWPIGMARVNASGEIEDTNLALQRMLGYGERELASKTFVEFATHPDDVRESAGLLEEVVKGDRQHYQVEKRYVKKEGQVMWARVTVSAILTPGRELRFLVGMVEDITEIKHAEEKVRLSEEAKELSESRLNSMLRNSPLIVRNYAPDGAPLTANEAWDDFWEVKEAPDMSSAFEDERLKEAGVVPYIEKSLEDGEPVSTPPLYYEPESNGIQREPRWIGAYVHPLKDDSGRLMEITVAVEDVSAYRNTEQALENSFRERERLQKALGESQERLQSIVRRLAEDMANERRDG